MTQLLAQWSATIIMPLVVGIFFAAGALKPIAMTRGVVSGAAAFAFVLSFLVFWLIVAPWGHGVYWVRPVVGVLTVIGVVRYIAGGWRMANEPAGLVARFSHGLAAIIAAAFTGLTVYTLPGLVAPPDAVDLAFPLEGRTFVVGHGGGAATVNYHHTNPAQAYALDIGALNVWGRRAGPLLPARPEDYEIWDAQIIAPCDGDVVWARDGLPDAVGAQRTREAPAGNAAAIACKGVVIFFAHMREGSLAVRAGDRVRTGEPIGRVGNSGNTTEPHLHIHAEKGRFAGEASDNAGAPITFDGRFLTRNAIVRRP